MGVLDNALEEIAKKASKIKALDEAVDTSAKAAGASRNLARQNFEQDAKALFEEYDALKQGLDPRASSFDDTRAAVMDEQRVLRQEEREKYLFNPDIEHVAFDIQAETREEFARRMKEQFFNPNFASVATQRVDMPPLSPKYIRNSYIADAVFQTKFKKNVFANKRVAARAKEWMGDSPYVLSDGTPRVLVHIDRQSDPIRGNTGAFIQTDDPLEIGIHSGTNEAAIQATIKHPDVGKQQFTAFEDMFDEVAGFTEDPTGFKNFVAETINTFFTSKFSGGTSHAEAFIDLQTDIEDILIRGIGVSTDEAKASVGKYTSRIRQLPTASSTPHLFRGKNGLHMFDRGGFTNETVADQLKIMYKENKADVEKINAIMGRAGRKEKVMGLREFIEEKGFDHILYHNTVEDQGTVSIINWNPDLMISLYDPALTGGAGGKASAATAMALGMLGINLASEQDNAEVR